MVAANSTTRWSRNGTRELEPVSHGHAVLHLQKRGQKAFEVEMRHGVEIGLFPHVSLRAENGIEAREDTLEVESGPIDLIRHVGGSIDQAKISFIDRPKKPLGEELTK